MIDRREVMAGSVSRLAMLGLMGCGAGDGDRYAAAAAAIRVPLGPDPDLHSFVRYATLAANGHNTQPWRFVATPNGVDILPDLARRTPVVDPDDHHLFVSLGCATENLLIAAAASGRPGSAIFNDEASGRIGIDLTAGPASDLQLCQAIPARQSTRSTYDGRGVPSGDLKLLERAAEIDGVSMLLILDRRRRELVLEHLIRADDAQLDDPAFVEELRRWLRFNADEAIRTGDGLYAASSGNRTAPTWLGRRLFPLVFTKKAEAARYVKHMRSSSGIAVFVGDKADRDHWTRVGRSFQRFALQATALGLRSAHVNQPIEVPFVRTAFARALGLGDVRPDLVIRFGAAPALPMSMRRREFLQT